MLDGQADFFCVRNYIIIIIILFVMHSPARSLQAKNYKLGFLWNGALPGTKKYSAKNVLLNASSFPLCSDMDSLWKRNCVSNGSSVIWDIFLPSAEMIFDDSEFQGAVLQDFVCCCLVRCGSCTLCCLSKIRCSICVGDGDVPCERLSTFARD